MSNRRVLEYVQNRINEARRELAADANRKTADMNNRVYRKADASMVENTALDQLAERIADRVIAELERRRPGDVGTYQRRRNMQGQGNYFDSTGDMDEIYQLEWQWLHKPGNTDDR